MENKKRRLMRDNEGQHRYKRVARPSLDGSTSVAAPGSASVSCPGALSELSDQVVSRLRRSVVSLASFDGDTKLRECTGICIETSCSDSEATILTARRLIPHTRPAASLTIKVRLPNDRIVTGRIEDCRIDADFFIVNIKNLSGVGAASLDHGMQFEPHTKVAAVWRCFSSGILMATSGLNLAPPSPLTAETILSTCRIHKAGIGGPLVDFNGNFVGMNSHTKMEKTTYLRRERILRSLARHGLASVRVKEGVDDAARARMNSEMKAIRPSLSAKSVARLSKSRKGALSKEVLSRLSMSVVALASFDGNTKLCECTGICIESSCSDATYLLTSINLIPYTWPRRTITERLRIEVRLPNNKTVTGWIEDPERYIDFFIVKINNVSAAHLSHLSIDRVMQFEPYRKVAAIWRYFDSGKLKTTGGVDLASVCAHTDEKMLSTCQIHEVGIGGPLVDFDGNFVGMNCSGTEQRKTPYVRRPSIRTFMWFRGMVSVEEDVEDAVRERIKSRYGESCFLMPGRGQYINRLDATFRKDILRKPFKCAGLEMARSAYSLASESSKCLASEMNQSVVSLASFNGFAKKFSCTGIFIKEKACSATILTSASLVRVLGSAHMIDDNLRIEVCLPDGFRVVGILKCYNLHYNVALVEIMGFWRPRTIKISGDPVTSSMDVISVGSLFAHRRLMAVEGKVLIDKQSELDCQELCVSTCKITKAGIGGPLIDTDGNFVGINFYDEEETPFLPRDVIRRLLNNKWSSADDSIVEGVENRWLLPGWTHRNADTIAAVDGNKWPLPEPRRLFCDELVPDRSHLRKRHLPQPRRHCC
ncbi:uncharacterized protein LOC124655910 [Lolium rigidum]|uniref:uncharacterized protein LOC124655910 n=1 Tax=Lolium rigidum TaxID=89674 RepID=UPI001F5CABCC|nr:uncharacterized protein LOC124655910 [Lolium rigidum]